MNMCHEIWKPIEGYEGLYEVSNLGRVKSLERYVGKRHHIKEKYLTNDVNQKGYCRVLLSMNGKAKHYAVHRLVAEAFIPNKQNKPQINHIDGNKANNCATNLEWCTASENLIHARLKGLNPIVENNEIFSKPVEMHSLLGLHLYTFKSIADAERHTGVDHRTISACCRHKKGHKTAGGFVWEYANGGEVNVS